MTATTSTLRLLVHPRASGAAEPGRAARALHAVATGALTATALAFLLAEAAVAWLVASDVAAQVLRAWPWSW